MEDKIYFTPGMRVKCKHLENAPEMYVIKKKQIVIKDKDEDVKTLQGIVCRWFDVNQVLREDIFSTKDLVQL